MRSCSDKQKDIQEAYADVAKLVDARDLKSLGLARTGSIPVVRTILILAKTRYEEVVGPVAQ